MPISYAVAFVIAASAFRLATLAVSIRHESVLRKGGAVEHGRKNSSALAVAHLAYYTAAAIEGLRRAAAFDATSATGLAVYLFGAIMLIVVIRSLGPLWTVKLIIARNHTLVTNPLFRAVRHPNYYLNIIPELVGFALTLHAFATLIVGLPLYLIPLVLRIRQEERVMHDTFVGY